MPTAVERLRLHADLMRLVRERAAPQPGPGYALAQARKASQITAILVKLDEAPAANPGLLPPSAVSIYNSGADTTETGMTANTEDLQKQATEALAAIEPGRNGYRAATVTAKLEDGREIALTLTDAKPSGWRNRYADIQRKAQWKLDGKVASKLAIQELTGEARGRLLINPTLRAAFEAQAPQLAAEFETFVRKRYEQLFAEFEGKIPAYPPRESTDVYTVQDIRMVLDPVSDIEKNGKPHDAKAWTLTLNEGKLKSEAIKYGDEAAVQWFLKTNEKLGALEQPELVLDRGGNLIVTGTRDGKKISLSQQRILKRSPLGTLFHQFPAHLYVDGKFHTEAAYKKLFKPAE
jgi:hypothetical protein